MLANAIDKPLPRRLMRLLLNGAAATLITLTALDAHAANKALLVGISDYADPRIEDLEGPRHDVDALERILVSSWGFAQENITTLKDKDATERNIKQQLTALINNSNSNDKLVFYFSGHGTSVHDSAFGARLNLPDGTGALVTHDFDASKHIARIEAGHAVGSDLDGLLVGRHDIRPLLANRNSNSPLLIAIDACFSGNAVRSIAGTGHPMRKRYIKLPTATPTSARLRSTNYGTSRCINCQVGEINAPFDHDNVVYFGAAAENQLAVDYSQAEIDAGLAQTIDNKPHGGFTDALLRVLSDETLLNKQLNFARFFNLVLGRFNAFCRDCGHNPVILPMASIDVHNNLMEPFVSVMRAPPSQTFQLASIDTQSNQALQRARGNESNDPQMALAGRDSRQFRNVASRITQELPGTQLSQTRNSTDILDSLGNLVTRLPDAWTADRLQNWLFANILMLAQEQTDAVHSQGQLGTEFRNPLLGPVAFEGENILFTLSLNTPAQLVMIVMDAHGQYHWLYPQTKREAKRVFPPVNGFIFPPANQFDLRVTEPWGTDHVVFYALPPQSEISSKVLNMMDENGVESNQLLYTALIDELTHSSERYSASHIRIRTGK